MARIEALIGDSHYQVNLILLMLQPSNGASVRPLLHDAGFELRYLEPELTIPVALKNRLTQDGVEVKDPSSPDIVIKNSSNEFVVFECKKRMFGSRPQPGMGDSQIKQARAFLLQIPKVLASTLPAEKKISSTNLTYLSQHEPSFPQTLGVKELCDDLMTKGYPTIPYGMMGLSTNGTTVFLHKHHNPNDLHSTLDGLFGSSKKVVVQEIDDPDNDPRSFYPLPWMPGSSSSGDDYEQAAFGTAILQRVTVDIARALPPCNVRLGIDDLLRVTTQGCYDRWHSRHVRAQLRRHVRTLIEQNVHRTVTVVYEGSPNFVLEVRIDDKDSQDKIVESLRKWEADVWVDLRQPGLFD